MSDMTEAPSTSEVELATGRAGANFDLLAGVTIRLSVEVGSKAMPLADLLGLSQGSVVELDRRVDDLLDILANGTLIARGEVVEADGRYAIRVTEIASPDHMFGQLSARG